MEFGKRNLWTFVVAIIIGLVSGSLISQLLLMVLPTGVVRDFLTKAVSFGLKNVEVDIGVINFSFGLNFNFTIVSMLIVVGIVYYFKWWL